MVNKRNELRRRENNGPSEEGQNAFDVKLARVEWSVMSSQNDLNSKKSIRIDDSYVASNAASSNSA